jgi:acetyl esterase/lipase
MGFIQAQSNGVGEVAGGSAQATSAVTQLDQNSLSMNPILGQPELKKTARGHSYWFYGDVNYMGHNNTQLLDIYIPVSTRVNFEVPAVLIIHGGGWATGHKGRRTEIEFAEFMVDEGYVAVSANYTLTEYEGRAFHSLRTKGSWPQNIYDCKSALRWIKQHAEDIGIKRDQIAVMGASAGGHLALLLGLTADCAFLNTGGSYLDQDGHVRCIINFYGIPDIRKWGGHVFIEESLNERPEVWALASPVEHLSAQSPPILIIHGTADPTVPFAFSEAFAEQMSEHGLTHEFVVVEGGGHSFGLQPKGKDLRPFLKRFLRENLN